MNMCDTFDRLRPTYLRTVPTNQPTANYPPPVTNEDYLVTHLRQWVQGYRYGIMPTRSGTGHHVCTRAGSDNRKTIPSTIRTAITALNNPSWAAEKAELKWVVCYLNNIRPDTTQQGWQQFECSHKCIEHGLGQAYCCIDARCLCWESKSVNQSRGNKFCMRNCGHNNCNLFVCHCQGFHNPPCI